MCGTLSAKFTNAASLKLFFAPITISRFTKLTRLANDLVKQAVPYEVNLVKWL